jgi:hypothetical protein
MTTPEQPEPSPGQPGAGWPAAGPAQPTAQYPATPQYSAAPYNTAPYGYAWAGQAYGYPQPSAGSSSTQDRIAGIMLLVGAALALVGSFPTLTTSVDTSGGATNSFTYTDKPWSFSAQGPSFNQSALQFLGLPLALGAAAALVVGTLLLVGFGSRRLPMRALALAGSGILFGATLTVAMAGVDDGQFDGSTRHTSLGAGFWVIAVSAAVALGAALPVILALFGSSSDTTQSTGYYATQSTAAAAAYYAAQMQNPIYAQQQSYMQPQPQAETQQHPQQYPAQPQATYAPPQPQAGTQQHPQQYPAQQPTYAPPQSQAGTQQQPQQYPAQPTIQHAYSPPQPGPGTGWPQPGQPVAAAPQDDPQQPTG